MMPFDLKEEMKLLENNYYNQLKIHFNLIDFKRSQFTFRKDNWLLTFPYNNIQKTKNDIELVRKLSIINALYVYFFSKRIMYLMSIMCHEKNTNHI